MNAVAVEVTRRSAAEHVRRDGPLSPERFQLCPHGISDRGRVRPRNEDTFLIAELTRTLVVKASNLPQSGALAGGRKAFVLMVADGVGGHAAGEVASGITVASVEGFLLNTLRRFSNLQADDEQEALRELQAALCQADTRIFEEMATHPQWQGMASTLTFALAVNWRMFVAHVGDTRCYLFSQGVLQRITRDHTLLADLVDLGQVTAESAARHPLRHVVTNALGGRAPGVQVELHRLDLHPSDRIVLCSDGLTDMVTEPEMAAILAQHAHSQQACEVLLALANERGGKDNITAIVADVVVA